VKHSDGVPKVILNGVKNLLLNLFGLRDAWHRRGVASLITLGWVGWELLKIILLKQRKRIFPSFLVK